MNTPAHLAASVLVWRKESSWGAATAVAIGAVLPDAPMFGFYGYQRWVAGRPEHEIWSQLYFQDDWQLFFDLFNSIPLGILIVVASRLGGFRWGVLFGASLLLHLLCDLPLHHDDAHRHFLPFTHWRFASPVSYWDPRHYGFVFLWIELAFSLSSCIFVARSRQAVPMRVLALATLGLYLAGVGMAMLLWGL